MHLQHGTETCRETLKKQIQQLQQENRSLEEANNRYSRLQSLEVEVFFILICDGQECYRLQQEFQTDLKAIQQELLQTKRLCRFSVLICSLEEEFSSIHKELKKMTAEKQQLQEQIQERDERNKLLKKQIRTLQLAYMGQYSFQFFYVSLITPIPVLNVTDVSLLPMSVCLRIFSFLDVNFIQYFGLVCFCL